MEIESSLWNIVFLNKRAMDNVQNCDSYINLLTAGHENIRAGFKCPQCYARVNMMR
jgi:hypothetical protein